MSTAAFTGTYTTDDVSAIRYGVLRIGGGLVRSYIVYFIDYIVYILLCL